MANEEVKSISTTEGKGDKKKEIRYSVEEISNGFIISESTEGKDAKGNYQYNTVKSYSKTNPLADSKISLKSMMKKSMPGS
jgi:hypothetical protein